MYMQSMYNTYFAVGLCRVNVLCADRPTQQVSWKRNSDVTRILMSSAANDVIEPKVDEDIIIYKFFLCNRDADREKSRISLLFLSTLFCTGVIA